MRYRCEFNLAVYGGSESVWSPAPTEALTQKIYGNIHEVLGTGSEYLGWLINSPMLSLGEQQLFTWLVTYADSCLFNAIYMCMLAHGSSCPHPVLTERVCLRVLVSTQRQHWQRN